VYPFWSFSSFSSSGADSATLGSVSFSSGSKAKFFRKNHRHETTSQAWACVTNKNVLDADDLVSSQIYSLFLALYRLH
jgi:hypothetical protein